MAEPMTPIMVRNVEPGPTVFMDHRSGTQVEWQGAGDPNGMDVQQVPAEIAQGNVAFIRALNKGVFAVEEAPEEIVQALARQRDAWQARQAKAKATTAEVLEDAPQANDLVPVGCIGPKANGTECGDPVTVRSRQVNERPPLCSRHAGLSGQFVLLEDETKPVTGASSPKRWVRVTTSARERQAR